MPSAIGDKPPAFDRVAFDYDHQFTDTPLARALRRIVWERLAVHIRPGMRILDIGCGTGEDAVWLARRGAYVIATDVSSAMLDVTRQKAQQAGLAEMIETFVLDAASPPSRIEPLRLGRGVQGVRIDGAFSNFGALNCVSDLSLIACALAEWVRPGGVLILVFMSRWCAWEIAWHTLHFQPRAALRRLRRNGVDARVGGSTIQVWYPSIGRIGAAFRDGFRLTRVAGLGAFLPPSYLEPVISGQPWLFRLLSRLERVTASRFPFTHLAHHVILELERVSR